MADWPERFTYVCNASRAAVVNALPLFHAGLDRIARVVVLCGAAEGSTDAHARAEALDPAERLGEYLAEATKRRIARPQHSFELVFGDPGNIGAWQKKTRALVDKSRRPVVYNIKGGTKEMAIGGVLGLSADSHTDVRLITVRDNLSIETVSEGGQETLVVPGGEILLPTLLRFYGFKEYAYRNSDPPHQQRLPLQNWYLHQHARIDAFVTEFEPHATALWPEVQRLTTSFDQQGQRDFTLPCRIELANPAVASAIARLDGMPGITFEWRNHRATACIVTDAFVARFLRGGWIEAAGFLALQKLGQTVGDAEVFANLHLSPELGNVPATEVDVALLCRSKLIVIEAKSSSMTGRASRDANERSLAQLETNKRQLLGQVGHALVLNPCITEDDFRTHSGPVASQVRRAGLSEFVGPGAIARMTERVRELLPPVRICSGKQL